MLDCFPQTKNFWEVCADEEMWAIKQFFRNIEFEETPTLSQSFFFNFIYLIFPEHFASNRKEIKELLVPPNVLKLGSTMQELIRRLDCYGKQTRIAAFWTLPEHIKIRDLEKHIFTRLKVQPFFQRYTTDNFRAREYFYAEDSVSNLKKFIDNIVNDYVVDNTRI